MLLPVEEVLTLSSACLKWAHCSVHLTLPKQGGTGSMLLLQCSSHWNVQVLLPTPKQLLASLFSSQQQKFTHCKLQSYLVFIPLIGLNMDYTLRVTTSRSASELHLINIISLYTITIVGRTNNSKQFKYAESSLGVRTHFKRYKIIQCRCMVYTYLRTSSKYSYWSDLELTFRSLHWFTVMKPSRWF